MRETIDPPAPHQPILEALTIAENERLKLLLEECAAVLLSADPRARALMRKRVIAVLKLTPEEA